MTETRHSHGTMRHDHEGGDIPHDHKLGDPPLPPPHRREGDGLLGVGLALIILGALAMFWQSANHSACNSGLVQALAAQSCAEVSFIWTGGLLALIVGAICAIIGAILLAKS